MKIEATESNIAFLVKGGMSSGKDSDKAVASVFASFMNQTQMSGNSPKSEEKINYSSMSGETAKSDPMNEFKINSSKKDQILPEDRKPLSKTENNSKQPLQNKENEEKLEKLSEDIKEEIAESLGVSKEEVEDVLEMLGITIADFSDLSLLTPVVMELTGAESPMVLLMNSKIQNLYQNIKELMTETAVELQTDMEGLAELLADFELSGMDSEETFLSIDGGKAMEETHLSAVTDELEQISVESKETEGMKKTDTDNTVEMPEQNNGKITAVEIESEETANEETTEENESQNAEIFSKDSMNPLEGHSKEGTAAMAYQNVSDAVSFNEQAQPVLEHYSMADLENIYRQVSEAVKVRMSSDMNSIELSLNPQNLGKVSVEVASKEGTVTAQFRVQDVMAKAALESQVFELKNTLNEQGIKVEAIEVTVASHEFERNLEENQQDQQKLEDAARQMNEKTAANRRNIHLGMEEGTPDDMREAEELMAKMMSENGNRMSLFA